MKNKQHHLISTLLLICLMVSVGVVQARVTDPNMCRGCHDSYKNIPSLKSKSDGDGHHPTNLDKSSDAYKNTYSKCLTCHSLDARYEKDCIRCHAPEHTGSAAPAIPFLKSMYLPDRHHQKVGKPIIEGSDVLYRCESCHYVVFNAAGESIGLGDWSECRLDLAPKLPADFVCVEK